MLWRSIIATSLGIALFRGAVYPGMVRYRAWRDGPRERVARRNWRGEYVADLTLIRVRRAMWFGVAMIFVIGFAFLFSLPTPHR